MNIYIFEAIFLYLFYSGLRVITLWSFLLWLLTTVVHHNSLLYSKLSASVAARKEWNTPAWLSDMYYVVQIPFVLSIRHPHIRVKHGSI
jgi:hypothetical protein